jgi:hypothetical protein
MVNGRPAPGAVINFRFVGDMGKDPFAPLATAGEEGRYRMTTYGSYDGVPPGDYLVEITWPVYRRRLGDGPDRLGGKYAKAESSGVKAHVIEGENVLPAFELKVDPNVITAAESAGTKTVKTSDKRKSRAEIPGQPPPRDAQRVK